MMNNNETDKGSKPVDFNRYGLLAEQIQKNETGGLDFNFGIGQRDAVEKKAGQIALLTNLPVKFTFNEREYVIDPDTASKSITPESLTIEIAQIAATISKEQQEINYLQAFMQDVFPKT